MGFADLPGWAGRGNLSIRCRFPPRFCWGATSGNKTSFLPRLFILFFSLPTTSFHFIASPSSLLFFPSPFTFDFRLIFCFFAPVVLSRLVQCIVFFLLLQLYLYILHVAASVLHTVSFLLCFVAWRALIRIVTLPLCGFFIIRVFEPDLVFHFLRIRLTPIVMLLRLALSASTTMSG